MLVTQQEFDRELERARDEAAGPEFGLFHPDSLAWRVCRESVVFLGAGRAALLQLAHPYVAHAIEQHSQTQTDPIGRFNRTFFYVYGMIFGSLDHVLEMARRVRRIHDTIHGPIDEHVGRFPRGHRYRAHDAGALLWVFATLVETSVMAYEIGVAPLSLAEKNEFYAETRRFARLFGIPDEVFPADWPAFAAYCARTADSDEIAVGRPARRTAHFLLNGASTPMRPLMRWYTTMTAGLLPPRVREQYELPWGRADVVVYRSSLESLRRFWPHLPGRARYVPAYYEALHRLEGRPRPDRVGCTLEKVLLQLVRPRDSMVA